MRDRCKHYRKREGQRGKREKSKKIRDKKTEDINYILICNMYSYSGPNRTPKRKGRGVR